MPRPSILFATSLGFATAAAVLPGQNAAPSAPDPIRRTSSVLTPQGDGLYGLGAGYAATFARDRFDFVPALGTRVATNQRLQVALRSIRHGGRELPLQRGVGPVPEGTTAIYHRSATVSERYDVRPDGVEQSFRFTALPGQGDLVVRCALGGELAPRAEPAFGGGLQFLLPGIGGATIGTVTGIDANGSRCAGDLRLVDGELELSLPAAFVDHAALPLVLDPLFGTRIDVTNSPGTEEDPDVAFASATGDWFVVWAQTQSTSSADLVGRFYNPTTGLGTTLLLGNAGTVRRPKVAYHEYQNRFLVVWEKGASWFGPGQIASRIVEGNRTLGPTLDLTATTRNCLQPALCGNPGGTASDTGGLVAYREISQTGGGLKLLPYTLPIGTAALTPGTEVTIDGDPTAELPRLSKAGVGTRLVSYAIAGFVRVQPVDQAGNALGGGYAVDVGAGNVLASDVDGLGQNFLLAHETPAASGKEITARMLTWNPANQSLTLASSGALTNNAVDDRDPVVALLGPKYAVAWTQAVGFLDYVVKVRPLATAGCTFCGTEATLTGPQLSESMPAIASRLAGGDATSPQALIVYQSATQLPAQLVGEITATQFTVALGTDTSTPLWGGCGNAVALSTNGGPFAIGNSAFEFRVTGSATAAIGLFVFGFGGQSLPCGSCTAVNPVVLGATPLTVGTGYYPLPVPCNSVFLGFALDAQVGVLGATTNVCPVLNTLSLSPARRFTVVE